MVYLKKECCLATFCFINVIALVAGADSTVVPGASSTIVPTPTMDPNLSSTSPTPLNSTATTLPMTNTPGASDISTTTPAIDNPSTANSSVQQCKLEYDEYQCLLEIKRKYKGGDKLDSINWSADEMDRVISLPNATHFTHIYYVPGVSATGVKVMGGICAFIIVLGNGAGFAYFFWLNFQPLSRKPTDDELDNAMDQDLPVKLTNREKRAAEFQYAAKFQKDTQTIMANEPQQSEQPSTIPSELMSLKGDNAPPPPRRGNGGGAGAARGGGRGAGRGGARGRGRK